LLTCITGVLDLNNKILRKLKAVYRQAFMAAKHPTEQLMTWGNVNGKPTRNLIQINEL